MSEPRPLPRLWCCAAADAPVVAVFGRCHASVRPLRGSHEGSAPPGSRWSCVLRWDWSKGTVTEGAWTAMELRPLRAVVSACGEYLLYHAKTNDDGPFSARLGPRYAISRLPWLAALTHPQSFGPGGAGTSQHALPKPQQEQLWRMFPGFFWGQTEEEWPRHLTAGPVVPKSGDASRTWRSVRMDDAIATCPELAFQLASTRASALVPADAPAAEDAPLPPHLIALHPLAAPRSAGPAQRGPEVELLAAVPSSANGIGTGWNVWEGQLRFFALVRAASGTRIEPLDGVRWAKPTPDGRLLTADSEARLRVLRWSDRGDALAWTVDQEHDLSGLLPRPAPPPREALRGVR